MKSIIERTSETLREYNQKIQELNSKPASFDYADRILDLREATKKKLIDLLEDEKNRIS
jgi:hypothetical protein